MLRTLWGICWSAHMLCFIYFLLHLKYNLCELFLEMPVWVNFLWELLILQVLSTTQLTSLNRSGLAASLWLIPKSFEPDHIVCFTSSVFQRKLWKAKQFYIWYGALEISQCSPFYLLFCWISSVTYLKLWIRQISLSVHCSFWLDQHTTFSGFSFPWLLMGKLLLKYVQLILWYKVG